MIESFSDWFFIVSLIIISLWLYKRWQSNRFLIVQIHRLPLRQLDEEGLEVAVPNHERDHDVIITREFSKTPPLWATQVERQYGVAVNNWVDFGLLEAGRNTHKTGIARKFANHDHFVGLFRRYSARLGNRA